MNQLSPFLEKEKYKKIKIKISKTHHLLVTAKINGFKGNFIIDTGASSSCVGFESVLLFNLEAKKSKIKAAGAGATGMSTQVAYGNTMQLGKWKQRDFELVIFDLSHVNESLIEHKTKAIDGIIGADVLIKGKAIIDYSNLYLYLL